MKIRRKLNGWVAATFAAALLTGSSAMAADGDPDAKNEVRAVAAISKLKKLENISLFYVKGMTWPSCAIGVRVKLSKLKFVDSKRYKRGVDMDVKMQLLTLALRPGQKPDSKLIAKAVDDAGYVAVEWYTMETGKLKTHPFPVPKR